MAKKQRAKRGHGESDAAFTKTLEDVLASAAAVLFPTSWESTVCTVHSRSAEHDTPLHVMAWQNDHEGARLLIHAGADVNAVGDMGETPLHIAIRSGDEVMQELLLRAGARRNIVSDFGERAE